MHETLENIQQELQEIIDQLQQRIPSDDPLAIAHKNWSYPNLSKRELINEAKSIITLIDEEGGDELGDNEPTILDYVRRLTFLKGHTIPQIWSNAANAVPAYLFTLQGLRTSLSSALTRDVRAETADTLKRLARQVRAMEARINDLQPRSDSLAAMVERIEQAHSAADQLPTDLDTLREARKSIEKQSKDSDRNSEKIASFLTASQERYDQILEFRNEAEGVLERCESAYTASTSVGLAAAFADRSKALSHSMWIWVGGLIGALGAGYYFGGKQLENLSSAIASPDTSSLMIALNVIISLFSIGAPVWFAWISTKQIGQRFRLSEDYAFKASVSQAYEGYRREAARIDSDMEAKLLASALTRLDELPLRLVENESHGSPLHEIANSSVIKEAIKTIPGFASQVRDLANNAISGVTSTARATRAQPQTGQKPESQPEHESQ